MTIIKGMSEKQSIKLYKNNEKNHYKMIGIGQCNNPKEPHLFSVLVQNQEGEYTTFLYNAHSSQCKYAKTGSKGLATQYYKLKLR